MAQASIPTGRPLDTATLENVARILGHSFVVESVANGPDGVTAAVRGDVAHDHLRRSVAQVLRVARRPARECVFSHEPADWRGRDAQPALEAAGDVQRLGPGLFAFGGSFLEVRGALDGLQLDVAARQGARAMACPPLWPIPVLRDINCVHDLPRLAMVAAGVAPDFAARSRFSKAHRRGSGAVAIACTAENDLAPAVHALAPTVCDCCCWLLRGRGDVADRVLTLHGHAFHNGPRAMAPPGAQRPGAGMSRPCVTRRGVTRRGGCGARGDIPPARSAPARSAWMPGRAAGPRRVVALPEG